MKSSITSIVVLLWIILPVALPGQKLGINTSTPENTVSIRQPAGVSLGSYASVLDVQYTGTNGNDVIAVTGISKPATNTGYGGHFDGGYIGTWVKGGTIGVNASADSELDVTTYGISSTANSSGDWSKAYGVHATGYTTEGTTYGLYGKGFGNQNSGNYGVSGEASGFGTTNYGVYGKASLGTVNWAGYFDAGNVHIQNNLGIGSTNPIYDLDIFGEQSVAMLSSNGAMNGSVLTLRNLTTSPILLGAINFSTATTTPGQIAYEAAGNLSFRVNNAERLLITSSGLMGIGRTPTTNRLEVEGHASKSSSGDWMANSDERLKKNIQPLDAQEMMEKLLALQGITYEWNDDKTGTERPEGIQYGFTAQNILDIFPSLVEEDALGYLQTAYGTYDAMMVEALRYLYEENQELRSEIAEIKSMLSGSAVGK